MDEYSYENLYENPYEHLYEHSYEHFYEHSIKHIYEHLDKLKEHCYVYSCALWDVHLYGYLYNIHMDM